MSKIVYCDKDFVVINKDVGISSLPDGTIGDDALTLTVAELENAGENSVLYPVHRLDKTVGGLLTFARKKDAAARLSSLLCEGGLNKEYFAVVSGAPTGGVMTDHILKNTALSKALVVPKEREGAKEAVLEYILLKTVKGAKGEVSLVRIKLKTGRFHQIRAQFSSRGYPLLGDKKYGSSDHRAKTPSLFAYRISLPTTKQAEDIVAYPNLDSYPWNLFEKKDFEVEND